MRGTAEARRAVRTLADRGAAAEKISLEPGPGWPILSTGEVASLVSEANSFDLPVVAHARGRTGPGIALAGGVDELVHLPCAPTPVRDVRELARRRVPIVATLDVQSSGDCIERGRSFVRGGGRLLYGSDFGNEGIPAGIDVEELRLMREAGLSSLEALRAATSEAGRHLGSRRSARSLRARPRTSAAFAGMPSWRRAASTCLRARSRL